MARPTRGGERVPIIDVRRSRALSHPGMGPGVRYTFGVSDTYTPGLDPLEAAQRQRAVVMRIVRICFVVFLMSVALLYAAQVAVASGIEWYFPVVTAALLAALGFLVDLATPRKKISTISGVFLGLFAGMLATVALSALIDLLSQVWIPPEALSKLSPFISLFKVMLGITLCYLGIATVLQTQDDFRLVIPYVEFAKQIRGAKPLLLDSSALIDARIVDVAGTGILQAPLVIPHFVIAELQVLADSGDRMKRARGRRGLDVIGKLQRSGLDVSVDETPVAGKSVDQMLVELAKRMPGTVVTTDVGLARVAQIQGVTVLNLHDVANALRPALIPGEQVSIRLVKPGEQPGQGVGYLEDGTMIVVEGGAAYVGEQVQAEVTSSLQTSAGRLIFARLVESGDGRRNLTEPGAAGQLPEAPGASPAAERAEKGEAAAADVNGAAAVGTGEASGERGAAADGPSGASTGGADASPPAAPAPTPVPAPAPASTSHRSARSPFPPKAPSRIVTGRNPRR